MFVHDILQHQLESKNAQKLSEQLVEVVRAAKESNKNLSYRDVCQATRLTSAKLREELGGMSHRAQNWIVILLVGVLVAGIVAGKMLLR